MTTAIKMDTRFEALTSALLRHENLWRPVPFYLRELPWESGNSGPCRGAASTG